MQYRQISKNLRKHRLDKETKLNSPQVGKNTDRARNEFEVLDSERKKMGEKLVDSVDLQNSTLYELAMGGGLSNE